MSTTWELPTKKMYKIDTTDNVVRCKKCCFVSPLDMPIDDRDSLHYRTSAILNRSCKIKICGYFKTINYNQTLPNVVFFFGG